MEGFAEGYQFAIAAVLGSVPLLVMGRAKEYTFKKLGWDSSGSEIGNQDLDNITGITRDYAERLHEEGIMNIQNLAFTDVEILSRRTMLSKSMVFNWKDDAILRLLTGNIGVKNFLIDSKESGEKTLYDSLSNVGINNVTSLASHLKCRRPTKDEKKKENEEYVTDTKSTSLLVKTLGWKDNEEYRYLLERICIQGKIMLGDPTQTSITAFAYK